MIVFEKLFGEAVAYHPSSDDYNPHSGPLSCVFSPIA
jgi:hypothetical protein